VGAERLWSLSRQGRWKPAILPLAVGLTLVAVPFGLDVHSTFVRARSAARYAALEALAGHRQQARSWLLYMDALQHRGSAEAKLERTYREKPDSRWILRTEKAAAYYALGEYRRAYEELRAVVRARPDFLRAQRGLYDVCSKLLAAGETDPAVRAARDAARARLSRGSGSP
jgi:tetratricopeptide (TPR) repeat protein